MIHLLSDKDQTRKSYKITPTQDICFTVRRGVLHYFTVVLCAPGCVRFEVRILSDSRCKILLFFALFGQLRQPKELTPKLFRGVENTPHDGQSWMRVYQQESEEDALKKAIKLRKV